MGRKYLAINKDVVRALKNNFPLYLVWRSLHDLIDPDIDPVHRIGWREEQAAKEEEWLEEAHEFLIECQTEEIPDYPELASLVAGVK